MQIDSPNEMAKAYSQDLREKALAALTHKKMNEVSETFGVHRDTLRRWRNQFNETGNCAPKQGYQDGHSHKITDWEAFCEFAEQHGEKTQAAMATEWPTQISHQTMSRALKTIGFTRKKRRTRTKNAILRSELPT